ncbi:MAG: class I SAM-dependent methyltransferase [Actinomycetota bacterium]
MVEKKYDRNARFYDFFEFPLERMVYSKWRKKYFSPLEGKILEVGVGTGKNIDYYHPQAEVTAIDFSAGMLEKARRKLAASGRKNVILAKMDVEDLAFKSGLFDYVIASTVFCSVPHPLKGLKEINRVLKPGAKAVMIEHVLSKRKATSLLQNLFNPLVKSITGVSINRDTAASIREAGMELVAEKDLAMGDVFKLFVAQKGRAAK